MTTMRRSFPILVSVFSVAESAGVRHHRQGRIQAARHAWLRYRDAWVEFGKVRYPAVPAHAWRAWFTRQRIDMWKALLDDRA
jgi:hypothetical protein